MNRLRAGIFVCLAVLAAATSLSVSPALFAAEASNNDSLFRHKLLSYNEFG